MVQTEVETNGHSADAIPAADAPAMPPQEPLPTMEEIVTRDVIETVVTQANPDLELLQFSSELGTAAGDNYMSVMYAVEAEVKSKKTGKQSTLSVMLKTMPRNAFRQQMINDCQAFVKDSCMYNQVFPDFVQFQKDQGLEEHEIFYGFPKCYATFNDGKTDFVAMENLRSSGYKMAGRIEGLDFDHCQIVMKNMAKFHAISYAKFKGDFDAIMKAYPFLEEKMFRPEDQIQDMQKGWIGGTILKLGETFRKLGHTKEAETVDLVYTDPGKFWRAMNALVGCKVEHAVIGHGDCWTNNFLFLYDNAGKPESIKFVDFQISRVASRGVDLGYFLHSSPQMPVLNERKMDLLCTYYDEFVKFSTRLGVEKDKQQTLEEFLQEVDDFKYYGLTMGLMLIPIISASSENVPDLETMSDDLSPEAMEEWFSAIKSKAADDKLLNLVKHHFINVKFLHRD